MNGNTAHFGKQVSVYFWKTVRIANREKFWKSLIFAGIISFLVMLVVRNKMFDEYPATKSGFFTITSACIWIGIFNTIQNVCKEHEIIHADARAGMSIAAYVLANALWQMILCLMEAIIIYGVSLAFIPYDLGPDDVLVFGHLVENFITVYLLLFGSACLGLMVSSVANNGTMAMVIMPFVLILQLIFCGVLFELNGGAAVIGLLTLSRWGMSAFGSVSDLNGIAKSANEPTRSFNKSLPEFQRLNPSLKEIKEPFKIETFYEHESGTVLLAWLCLLILTVVSVIGTIVILKMRNKES